MKYFNTKSNSYTNKDVLRLAWAMYADYIRQPWRVNNIGTRADRRYNFNNEVIKEYNRIIKERAGVIDEDRKKHQERRKNKFIFKNVLSNHLVKDFKETPFFLRLVYPDRLNIAGRNHYARNGFDKKILAILKKWQ